MYRLITDVWAKKPLQLTILQDGKERQITARFDGEANGERFAGKMAYGNRRGNRTERLITLNLANDIWEIANESRYENSKGEFKQTRMHESSERWHYFVNAINYVDDAQPGRNGVYDFNLDVMERDDGDFVYTFSLKKRRTDAPRTFTAGVDGKNAADAGSSKNSISKTGETVKGKMSAQDGRYRDLMGEKAAQYVRRLESGLVNELAENLSVPGQAKREVLRPMAEEALRTFFTDGQLDRAKLNDLFETA